MRHLTVAGLAVVCLGAAGAGPAGGAQDPLLEEVLRRAAAYVADYRQQFALLVGDERYVQRTSLPPPFAGSVWRSTTREIRSEIVLAATAEGEWLAFRDVIEVDGRPVTDRGERVARLLLRQPRQPPGALRRLADESSRFNLGDIRRNYNEPLLALLFLDAAHQERFRFERRGTARIRGIRMYAVSYAELVRPTIIQLNDRSIASEGVVWIDPDTGRVLKTAHELFDAESDLRSRIVVSYRLEPRLQLWLPEEMKEEYTRPQRPGRPPITGTAKYSNFRRFEVESRLLVPEPPALPPRW